MYEIETSIPGVRLLVPQRHEDDRGFFSEVYNKQSLADIGISEEFVQDNHSMSTCVGVVRGLHLQIPPHAQAKLIRVTKGAIFDVVVDLRRESETFGATFNCILSADNWHQLFIPIGFAHGFCTLEPNTEVHYKASDFYAPKFERGVFWADPSLNIPWPTHTEHAVLSDRDKAWPLFSELDRFL